MEFFPPQPDLSLKISPPNTQNTSRIWQTSNQTRQDHGLNMGHFLNTLSTQNNHHGSTTRPNTPFGFYLPYPAHSNESNLTQITNTTNLHDQYHHQQLGFLSPVNGAPIYYQNTPHPNNFHMLAHQYHQQNSQPSLDTCNIASSTSSSSLSHGNSVCHIARSRFLSARYPGKRSARAPRMRWTTTLHARFEQAVEHLGGHERATPKSVLELMDVKDLTLAHVKSHLQMYRTIKTTDKALVSSGQSEVYENGSSADNYDDIMFGIQNQRRELLAEHGGRPIVHQDKEYGLWSNSSSREVLLHGKHGDFEANMPSLEQEMNLKGTKNERSSEVSSSSHSETSLKKPNLEFTLGSAH